MSKAIKFVNMLEKARVARPVFKGAFFTASVDDQGEIRLDTTMDGGADVEAGEAINLAEFLLDVLTEPQEIVQGYEPG